MTIKTCNLVTYLKGAKHIIIIINAVIAAILPRVPAVASWVSYLTSPIPNQHRLLLCLLSTQLELCGMLWIQHFSPKRRTQALQMLGSLGGETVPLGGWTGHSFRKKEARGRSQPLAVLACSTHWGTHFPALSLFDNETWVPPRERGLKQWQKYPGGHSLY